MAPKLWRADAVNMVPGAPHACLVVAASNASAKVKATADYLCDGTADNVQISAAILAASTVGGTVQLSEGTFNIAAPVAAKNRVHLKGANHYATILKAAENANCDIITHAEAAANGGWELSDLTIHGRKWQAYYGSSDFTSYIVAVHRITGCSAANITDANGRLYLSIVEVNATPTWRIDFYADSARLSQIAHTDNFTAAGLVAVNADAASGLGGFIGVRTAVKDATYWKARADVVLIGNYAGDGFSCDANMWDSYFSNFIVQNCAERGMDLGQAWGNIIQTGWIEWCNSDGIRCTAGSDLKVANMKIIANDGHALSLDGGSARITNCELVGGQNALVDAAGVTALWSTGKAGIYLGSGGVVEAVNSRFDVLASCYGVLASDTALTSGSSIVGCAFTKGHATLTTATVGVSIPERDDAAGSGTYWRIIGNSFSAITTGFQVTAHVNRVGTNGGHLLAGNIFKICTTGVILTSRYNLVTGCEFAACTTGISIVDQQNVVRNSLFVGGTSQISIEATGDYANIEGCWFNTGTTCILITGAAYGNVIRNNTFNSGVSVTMAAGTATIEYNVGAGAIVEGSGTVVSGKCTAVESGSDIVHKTVLTFTLTTTNDLDLPDSDPSYVGVKVYDFPAGDIHILSAVLNGVTTVGGGALGTPVMSFGTAAEAADATLDGVQANVIPSVAIATDTHQVLSEAITLDGTGTAIDLFINAAAATVGSGAATVAVTGTLTIVWTNGGDY